MKKGFVSWALALALVFSLGLLAPGTARADMHCHGMMHHGGPIAFYLMNQDRLGLTPDQVKKLSTLKMDFMKTMIMEKARIHVLHMETMALMMHHRIDVSKAKSNMDAILNHKRAIMHAYLTMISGAHRVLTADQFATAKKLWRQMMMMHHGMMMPHPMAHHPGM